MCLVTRKCAEAGADSPVTTHPHRPLDTRKKAVTKQSSLPTLYEGTQQDEIHNVQKSKSNVRCEHTNTQHSNADGSRAITGL